MAGANGAARTEIIRARRDDGVAVHCEPPTLSPSNEAELKVVISASFKHGCTLIQLHHAAGKDLDIDLGQWPLPREEPELEKIFTSIVERIIDDATDRERGDRHSYVVVGIIEGRSITRCRVRVRGGTFEAAPPDLEPSNVGMVRQQMRQNEVLHVQLVRSQEVSVKMVGTVTEAFGSAVKELREGFAEQVKVLVAEISDLRKQVREQADRELELARAKRLQEAEAKREEAEAREIEARAEATSDLAKKLGTAIPALMHQFGSHLMKKNGAPFGLPAASQAPPGTAADVTAEQGAVAAEQGAAVAAEQGAPVSSTEASAAIAPASSAPAAAPKAVPAELLALAGQLRTVTDAQLAELGRRGFRPEQIEAFKGARDRGEFGPFVQQFGEALTDAQCTALADVATDEQVAALGALSRILAGE